MLWLRPLGSKVCCAPAHGGNLCKSHAHLRSLVARHLGNSAAQSLESRHGSKCAQRPYQQQYCRVLRPCADTAVCPCSRDASPPATHCMYSNTIGPIYTRRTTAGDAIIHLRGSGGPAKGELVMRGPPPPRHRCPGHQHLYSTQDLTTLGEAEH